jgi:hypothetical protein
MLTTFRIGARKFSSINFRCPSKSVVDLFNVDIIYVRSANCRNRVFRPQQYLPHRPLLIGVLMPRRVAMVTTNENADAVKMHDGVDLVEQSAFGEHAVGRDIKRHSTEAESCACMRMRRTGFIGRC